MKINSRYFLPIIFVLGIISFAPTLTVKFIWDDHEMIEKNPWIQVINMQTIKHAFTNDVFDGKGDAYYRPLQTLLNMWDLRVWGMRPFGFHLTNLLFHLFSALLLFQLIFYATQNKNLAFLTSIFFVIHPIIVECFLNISGRTEPMALFFGLAFLYCAFQNSWKMTSLAGLCLAAASLSKESGIIFPFFLPLFALLNSKNRISLRKYFLFGAVIGGYFLWRFFAFPFDSHLIAWKEFIPGLLRDVPAILVKYVRILIFPIDLHSHRRAVISNLNVIGAYLVIIVLAALIIRRKNKLEIFCAGWFLIGFAPKIGLLATNALMLDHWAYWSAIPLCLLLGKNLLDWGKRKKGIVWAWTTGILIGGFWISLGWFSIAHRNTDKKLYEWALRFPSSSIVRNNLAQIYYFEGNFSAAEKLYLRSLAMDPGNPLTLNGLALVYWKEGNKDRALEILNGVIEKNPHHLQSYVNRAVIRRGKEGLEDLKYVLSINPNYEFAWTMAGSIFAENNKLDEAIMAYSEVVRLNPHNVQAFVDLGTLNGMEGHFAEAEKYWKKALAIQPNNEIAIRNLLWLAQKQAK